MACWHALRVSRWVIGGLIGWIVWTAIDALVGVILGVPGRFSGDPTPLMLVVTVGSLFAAVGIVGYVFPRVWR
jgi:hypothetical protein